VWDRVGRHQFLEFTAVQLLNGVAAQNAMRYYRNSLAGTVIHDNIGGLAQCATRIRHVVHNNCNTSLDVTHKCHARDLTRLGTLLVDERKAEIESVGNACRSLCTTGIWGHNNTVLDWQVFSDPAQSGGLSVEVVHWYIEEALNLACVQVHCDDMVAASGLQHVGHELGRDRSSTLILLILSRVGEVGQHRCNTAG
jgi:hypothetical protein